VIEVVELPSKFKAPSSNLRNRKGRKEGRKKGRKEGRKARLRLAHH
jgi:hypothetical protein